MPNAPLIDHQIRRPVVLAADPATTGMTGGEVYYNSARKQHFYYNGVLWEPVAPDVPVTFKWNGPLQAQTGVDKFYVNGDYLIVDIKGHLAVPGSANVRVDVNKNGTTVHTTQTNRLNLNAANSGVDAITSGNIEVNYLVDNDYLSFDIDSSGGGTAQTLTVVVWLRRGSI